MNQTALRLPVKGKKSREWAEPVFTQKLAEAMGSSSAAADRIGVAASTISTGIRDRKINTPIETAARYWFEREYIPKVTRTTIVCAVPGDKVQSLKDFVGHLGGEIGPVFTL